MKRCFIAVKFLETEYFQNQLNAISRELDVKIKLPKPENYHFTLHFIGDVDSSIEQSIISSLRSINYPSFDVTLGSSLSFPKNKLNKTRILAIKPITGTQDLIKLHSQIKSCLIDIEITVDKRQYNPHLTIARVKYGSQIEKLTVTWNSTDFEKQSHYIDKFSFYESKLTPQGATYSIISDFPLIS